TDSAKWSTEERTTPIVRVALASLVPRMIGVVRSPAVGETACEGRENRLSQCHARHASNRESRVDRVYGDGQVFCRPVGGRHAALYVSGHRSRHRKPGGQKYSPDLRG